MKSLEEIAGQFRNARINTYGAACPVSGDETLRLWSFAEGIGIRGINRCDRRVILQKVQLKNEDVFLKPRKPLTSPEREKAEPQPPEEREQELQLPASPEVSLWRPLSPYPPTDPECSSEGSSQ